MAGDDTADKQQITAPGRPFPKGVSGNPAGRPKRKTLTELIHAKLDDTPEAWEAIVGMVIQKLLKEKDNNILRTFWEYTDGKPVQKNVLAGDEDNPLRIDISTTLDKIYGQEDKTSTGEMHKDSKDSGSTA